MSAETIGVLRARERVLSDQLATEIVASIEQKPTVMDMAKWAAAREADQYGAYLARVWLNGSTAPDEVRELAVARKTIDLLVLVARHEDEVRTLFRAKAWRKRRRQ